MPIAIKDSKIDITSEKLTKELAKKFTKYLNGGEYIFLYAKLLLFHLYVLEVHKLYFLNFYDYAKVQFEQLLD